MTVQLRGAAMAVAFLLALSGTVLAQGVQSGIIRGSVKSSDGLSVPGATVTVKSPVLQGERATLTESSGGYAIPSLPPGDYTVTFSLSGMTTVEQKVTVPLGGVAEVNATLKVAPVAEVIQVVGQSPTVLTTPTVGANYKHEEIDALATPRTLAGIASLSPGLTENSPNQGQVVINGAFAYDNIFMLNGVDVNDNLFANPQNLFIEDAIEETQILTSGISAEYGRFTGGVVNAITRSGGNTFSGSYRLSLSNDDWSTRTPFEVAKNITRISKVNKSHEGTFGGPVAKDRLWFFLAGRYADTSNSNTLPYTGNQYVTGDNNKRGELKVTGRPAEGHTLQGSYLNDPRTQTVHANFAGAGLATIDPAALSDRSLPNRLFALNYKGVLKDNLLAEVQYSERKFEFNGGGGTSPNIVDSPFLTLNITGPRGQYNAPYFDATDPEQRNNRQVTGSVSYFLDRAGRHEIKGGYEFFRSQRTGGNSQSSTNYVFLTDYAASASGNPILDSNGRIVPLFVPGETIVQHWIPTRGAVLNIDNNSLYGQDHWTINNHVSADLGVRFEKVKSTATGNIVGVDTHRAVPRLAAAYDLNGDGKYVLHATYAHYSGRYNEATIGNNTPVGNPTELDGLYAGPAGQGRTFAPGFNQANYTSLGGTVPTANIFFDPNLKSAVTREFTFSGGGELGRNGSAQASYIWRRTNDIIEDFISLANGTTHVVQSGEDLGTFTNVVFRNSDIPTREYQGLLFQGRYNLHRNWSLNGHWTVQLKNDGNYEGEASNQPGITSVIGDYPQIFTEARHYPTGPLQDFQRHKVHVWSIYNLRFGRLGDAAVSGLWRYNSARVYSLRAAGQPLTAVQNGILTALGYPDAPQSQTVYYSTRGSQEFPGYGLFDVSLNYNIPVYKTARPWLKFDTYNLFDNQKLISWNTTIRQDSTTARDALGLRTGYVKGSLFGQATSNSNFPIPFTGQTGGRTFRVSFGLRF